VMFHFMKILNDQNIACLHLKFICFDVPPLHVHFRGIILSISVRESQYNGPYANHASHTLKRKKKMMMMIQKLNWRDM
jgi:hypothetical protein